MLDFARCLFQRRPAESPNPWPEQEEREQERQEETLQPIVIDCQAPIQVKSDGHSSKLLVGAPFGLKFRLREGDGCGKAAFSQFLHLSIKPNPAGTTASAAAVVRVQKKDKSRSKRSAEQPRTFDAAAATAFLYLNLPGRKLRPFPHLLLESSCSSLNLAVKTLVYTWHPSTIASRKPAAPIPSSNNI